MELYFEESASKLDKLSAALAPGAATDFSEVDALVHQFKGSSASFGARQMATLCVQLRDACATKDVGACERLVEQLRERFAELRGRLQRFLEQERQRKAGR